jgi:hypothetical protein
VLKITAQLSIVGLLARAQNKYMAAALSQNGENSSFIKKESYYSHLNIQSFVYYINIIQA